MKASINLNPISLEISPESNVEEYFITHGLKLKNSGDYIPLELQIQQNGQLRLVAKAPRGNRSESEQ